MAAEKAGRDVATQGNRVCDKTIEGDNQGKLHFGVDLDRVHCGAAYIHSPTALLTDVDVSVQLGSNIVEGKVIPCL